MSPVLAQMAKQLALDLKLSWVVAVVALTTPIESLVVVAVAVAPAFLAPLDLARAAKEMMAHLPRQTLTEPDLAAAAARAPLDRLETFSQEATAAMA